MGRQAGRAHGLVSKEGTASCPGSGHIHRDEEVQHGEVRGSRSLPENQGCADVAHGAPSLGGFLGECPSSSSPRAPRIQHMAFPEVRVPLCRGTWLAHGILG